MKLLPNILPKTCNRIYNIIIKIINIFIVVVNYKEGSKCLA